MPRSVLLTRGGLANGEGRRYMKKLSLSVLALLPFVLLALWFGWTYGVFPDVGAESGYYGQFNRVKHVIEDMPDVQIVDSWKHRDVTLEDFGFTLFVGGCRRVDIRFYDNTPEKNEKNKSRLRETIRKQLDSNKSMQATPNGAPDG